eukprot:gene1827-4926_t
MARQATSQLSQSHSTAEEDVLDVVIPDPYKLHEWKAKDVTSWLEIQIPRLSVYSPLLQSHGICGRVIAIVDRDTLLSIGISAEDCDIILKCFVRLGLEQQKRVVENLMLTARRTP